MPPENASASSHSFEEPCLTKSRSFFHLAYLITIGIKGFDGALETIFGLIVLFVGKTRLYAYAIHITAPEITGHPVTHAGHMIRHNADTLMQASAAFVITYLLIHGILKLGIAISLIRERSLWIFPVSAVILTGFVIFMLYKLALHRSGWLLAFAIFDLVTIALVLNEWRNFRIRASGVPGSVLA